MFSLGIFSLSLSLRGGRECFQSASSPLQHAGHLCTQLAGRVPCGLVLPQCHLCPFPVARDALSTRCCSEGLPARLQAGALVRAVHSAAAAVRLRRPG